MSLHHGVRRVSDFEHDPVTVGHSLLGARLVRWVDGQRLAGTIVEVEAYLGVEDQAAHTYGGRRTSRNEAMYLPGGHAYVYFIYGMHYCLNVVCGRPDEGVAVLIRAIEPVEGVGTMRINRRGISRERDLTRGPARLSQAMQIDTSLNAADLRIDNRLWIEHGPCLDQSPSEILCGPRIGVDYAGSWACKPLRFWIEGNRFVSGSAAANRGGTRKRD